MRYNAERPQRAERKTNAVLNEFQYKKFCRLMERVKIVVAGSHRKRQKESGKFFEST